MRASSCPCGSTDIAETGDDRGVCLDCEFTWKDGGDYFEYVDIAYEINKETWPEMTEEAALADAIAFADRVHGTPGA